MGLSVRERLSDRLRNRMSGAGYSLLEMLIVIAIIAVIIAIALPVVIAQIENARRTADEANARTAYAAAVSQYLFDGEEGTVTYIFDTGPGKAYEVTTAGHITGYGQWGHEADYEVGGIPVTGIAREEGRPNYITITMSKRGIDSIHWGLGNVYSSATAGRMNNASDLEKKSFDTKVLQTLADKIARMSVSELNEYLGLDVLGVTNSEGATAFTDENGYALFVVDQDSRTGAAAYGVGATLLSDMGYESDVTTGDASTRRWSNNEDRVFYSIGDGEKANVRVRLKVNGDDVTEAYVWLEADDDQYPESYEPLNRDNYFARSYN